MDILIWNKILKRYITEMQILREEVFAFFLFLNGFISAVFYAATPLPD